MMKAPLRPGTRPVDAAQFAVEDTPTDGPYYLYLLLCFPTPTEEADGNGYGAITGRSDPLGRRLE